MALPSLLHLPSYHVEPLEDQWREATAFVELHNRDGDLVLITSAYNLTPLPFEWYASTPPSVLPRQVFPQRPETGVLTDVKQLESLPSTTDGHRRVWFLFCYVSRENQALIAGAMKNYQIVDERSYVGLDLLLFERCSH